MAVEPFHDHPQSEGVSLGQLVFPANFELFEVDESRIVGMAKDSMEVETVQVLRLKRR